MSAGVERPSGSREEEVSRILKLMSLLKYEEGEGQRDL